MSSSVFYKFKNSREPERIVFDGTDITVFELKREIITASGLGDGTDFDLHLFPEDDPKAEYKDDTTTISRSSTVVAVRRPAARGHGRAARYVSGKAPVRAIKKDNRPAAPVAGGALNEADAEAAFLAESAQVWDAQKETLSHAKPVHHKKKPVNVPLGPLPKNYVCDTCHREGHWRQACPANNDPNFKKVFQPKRTTGIPQSMLKKVEKPVDEEAAKGIMLNPDGEYVQVMTDTRTWEKFQEKANASKAQAARADAASLEVRERGLECPLDKQLFVDPVKTPCCSKTYCHGCIDNALAEGDLICPNCATEDVLMDDLVPDEEMIQSIKAYEADKAKEKLEKEEQAMADAKAAEHPASPLKNETESSVPVETSATTNDTSIMTVATKPVPSGTTPGAGGNGSDTESTSSKKRKSPPSEIKPPTAPKAMRQQKEQASRQVANPTSQVDDFMQQMEALKNAPQNMLLPGPMMGMPQAMNNMPNVSNTMGYQMPYNNMGFPNGPMNTPMMMNPQMMGMPMHMQNMQQMPMHHANPQMMGMNGMNGSYGGNMGGMHNQNQNQWQTHNAGYGGAYNGGYDGNGGAGYGQGMGGVGAGAAGADYNDAYERQPVNPRGRHRKAARAPDYRHVQ